MEETCASGHQLLAGLNVILNTATIMFMTWLAKRYPNGNGAPKSGG